MGEIGYQAKGTGAALWDSARLFHNTFQLVSPPGQHYVLKNAKMLFGSLFIDDTI